VQTQRWFNQTQPQTLQIAVFLLYMNAVFALLFGLDPEFALLFGSATVTLLRLVLPAAYAAGGYGIANERRWGYYAGLAAAILPLATRLLVSVRYQINPLDYNLLGLLFDVALVALLVHPQSREYQKIWFK
jgi:hypothetical protein